MGMRRTPEFECSQDDASVHLRVRMRGEVEGVNEDSVQIDGCCFGWRNGEYELKLTFPRELGPRSAIVLEPEMEQTDGLEKKTGWWNLSIPKQVPGMYFENLDILRMLVSEPRRRSSLNRSLIEVLSSESYENSSELEDCLERDGSAVTAEEESIMEKTGVLTRRTPNYGFNNRYYNFILGRDDIDAEAVELPEPDNTPAVARTSLRLARENEKFDPEYYAADIDIEGPLEQHLDYHLSVSNLKQISPELEAESENLPRREYLIESATSVLSSLVDILFAFFYEFRTTEGEFNVESGWTVTYISATLSWFESFKDPRSAVVASFRRSLSYPLYRNFRLSQRVLKDVKKVFMGGRLAVFHSLLRLKQIFDADDDRSFLNELYIEDYCIWIRSLREETLEDFAKQLAKVSITKEEIGWDLEVIEEMVQEAKIAS